MQVEGIKILNSIHIFDFELLKKKILNKTGMSSLLL